MFSIVATLVFSAAFFLGLGTIAWMFALYRDKMIAALTFAPIPLAPPVYQVRIQRRRAPRDAGRVALPIGALAA